MISSKAMTLISNKSNHSLVITPLTMFSKEAALMSQLPSSFKDKKNKKSFKCKKVKGIKSQRASPLKKGVQTIEILNRRLLSN